jgi:hypothetical protein
VPDGRLIFRLHLTDTELWDFRSTLLDEPREAMRRGLYPGPPARGGLIAPSGLGCLSTPMGGEEVQAFLDSLDDRLAEFGPRYL